MKKFCNILFLVLFVIPSTAQDLVFPELRGYRKQMEHPVFTPANLHDYLNAAAENYLTYDFLDLHVAEYKKGRETIKLEIYRFRNNTLAFGIYSSERSSSARFVKIGAQGYVTDASLNFFKGAYYVKISSNSLKEKTRQSEQSLAGRISEMLPGEASIPSAVTMFPDEGRKKNQEVFINENVLGHKFLNGAFRADYELGTDIFRIYIMEKASASGTRETVNTYLITAGIDPADDDNGKIVINDGYNGTIFLAWRPEKIVIISGLERDQSELADRYASEILE